MSLIKINDIEYDTHKQEDRRKVGKIYEDIFYKYLIKYDRRFKHMSIKDPYGPYDFIKNINDNLIIIELKTRIKKLSHHSIELLDYNKIENYKKIQKKHPKSKFIFVFNHIDTDNDNYNQYYFYEVNFLFLENNIFIDNIFGKKTYELPIKYLNKLDDYLEILK